MEKFFEEIKLNTQQIKENPNNAEAYYSRGLAHSVIGNLFQSMGSALKAKEELAAAFADYQKAIELDSNLTGVHHDLGLLFLAQDKHEAAIQEFSLCIEKGDRVEDSYFNRGVSYLSIEEDQKAIDDISKALEMGIIKDSRQARAYSSRGKAYLNLKNYVKARNDFFKASELSPYGSENDNLIGVTYALEEKYLAAEEQFTKGLEKEPHRLDIRMNRGRACEDQKKYQAALDDFQIILKAHPGEEALKKRIATIEEKIKENGDGEEKKEISSAVKVQSQIRATGHCSSGYHFSEALRTLFLGGICCFFLAFYLSFPNKRWKIVTSEGTRAIEEYRDQAPIFISVGVFGLFFGYLALASFLFRCEINPAGLSIGSFNKKEYSWNELGGYVLAQWLKNLEDKETRPLSLDFRTRKGQWIEINLEKLNNPSFLCEFQKICPIQQFSEKAILEREFP